jgi:predicted transcriptional regulator
MKFIISKNNLSCDNIIQCIFDLNKLDLKVYKTLKEEIGEIRADELAKKLVKDRSTVYRSLQKLTCCRLCIKETRTIDKGGYYHTYTCSDLSKIKKEIERHIDSWYKKMKNTVKDLE